VNEPKPTPAGMAASRVLVWRGRPARELPKDKERIRVWIERIEGDRGKWLHAAGSPTTRETMRLPVLRRVMVLPGRARAEECR